MDQAVHKDYLGAKLGMWLFLFTEVILFGGLFILYAIYHTHYPQEFAKASRELNLIFGTVNTAILLTSSLTVALSISAVRNNNRSLTLWLLIATILLALLFLMNKYFEWSEKIHHGLYPTSAVLNERLSGEILFFVLYFITTGLHGLHVLVGAVILAVMARGVFKERIYHGDLVQLENSALYWHLVDIIWIFIFPLYYLIL